MSYTLEREQYPRQKYYDLIFQIFVVYLFSIILDSIGFESYKVSIQVLDRFLQPRPVFKQPKQHSSGCREGLLKGCITFLIPPPFRVYQV